MSSFNGLPVHILLVHAIVVLVPLMAFLLVLCAAWPTARRHLALPNLVLSVGTLLLVPLTTNAGEWLQRRVPNTSVVQDHAEAGGSAVIVTLPLLVLALVVWWRARETTLVEVAGRPEGAADAAGGVGSGRGSAVLTALRPTADRTFLAPGSAAVGVVIIALSVLAAGAAVFDIYRIGDSGARASWQDRVSSTPAPGGDG